MPFLRWLGREAVEDHHRNVPVRLLDVDPDAGAGDADAGNLIVEGDNLEALRALLPRYAGRVDCVYIDPPYNTGNEGWVYNDAVNGPEVRAWLGRVVGGEAEDLTRHDKWLTMMWPRLWLLKELLAETGSIWISLDDNEAHRARVVLDEVFGRSNFVASFIWRKVDSPNDNKVPITADHEYILCYVKSKGGRVFSQMMDESILDAYRIADDGVTLYRDRLLKKNGKNSMREDRPTMYFPIVDPDGNEVYPVHDSGRPARWAAGTSTVEKHKLAGTLIWKRRVVNGAERWEPYTREFAPDDPSRPYPTIWTDLHTMRQAKAGLKPMFAGDDVFDTPKPVDLIQRILRILSKPDALVLDAFAGSGTTAHAVLKQNALDGGRRRFVLVEMIPEVAQSVTAARVRRAVEGYSVTGSVREELHRETVTLTTLRKADKALERVADVQARHADRFDTVKAEVRDGALVVVGERKETKRVDGLGSGFRYARLGAPLLDDDGALHPAVTYADLAAFAFLHATGGAASAPPDAEAPLVGVHGGVAVYLLGTWGGDGASDGPAAGTLTRAVLATLPPHDGDRIVYGEASLIPDDVLASVRVTFRQVPYCFTGATT